MATLFAYLDPGSGSMILQALLGGAAGLFVAIKMFGQRIKSALFFWRTDDADTSVSEPATKAAVAEPAPEAEVKTGA